MANYVVNNRAQANGDHEVHKEGCTYFPSNYKNLGNHSSCHSAIAKAKETYLTANGCKTCSNACNTG